ncbi:hypothetical protein [Roseibium sp.]|uniref:hypothetical protein n=1 Tax=Roseibium sp. TaxID=1936156 RepID=UPI003A96ABDC
MKKTLAIFAAGTALTAVIALPAYSAFFGEGGYGRHFAEHGKRPAYLMLASDDDDDERGDYRRSRHDDDHRSYGRSRHDDDDDDDDDDGRYGARANPAPAGTVAPPQNGLFGNGAGPKVQVN